MSEAIPLGRITGFDVKVHWSVVVILGLFTWSLANTLPHNAPGYRPSAYWLSAACGALVLLASLLAHELAHAVVARRTGVPVESVTLWLFGGVTRMQGEPKTPKTAFQIAIAGPVTSLVLAAAFAAFGASLDTVGAAHIVVGIAWWLASINLVLGVFNLLPGAPLDGGRLVRAYLWHRRGDSQRAAIGAARAGRVVAFVLIGLGLIEFVLGGGVGGLWMALIGWFILGAARQEESQVTLRQALTGVRVADAMTADPHTVPARLTVADFIERYLLGDRHSAYPVADPNGTIIGLVTLSQLRGVAPVRRATTAVGDIALPLTSVPVAAPDEPLWTLLERLGSSPHGGRALVRDPSTGGVIGIVTPSDLIRVIDVYRLAQPGPGPAAITRQPEDAARSAGP